MQVVRESGTTLTTEDLVRDGMDARAIGVFAKILGVQNREEISHEALEHPFDSVGHVGSAIERLCGNLYIDITQETETRPALMVIRSREGRSKQL